MTAYCTDCGIIAGGYSQRASAEEDDRQVLLFIAGSDSSAATYVLHKGLAVESSGLYTLNEVRAIDPASGHILFAATSEDGEQALLVAPFAATPAASSACDDGNLR